MGQDASIAKKRKTYDAWHYIFLQRSISSRDSEKKQQVEYIPSEEEYFLQRSFLWKYNKMLFNVGAPG